MELLVFLKQHYLQYRGLRVKKLMMDNVYAGLRERVWLNGQGLAKAPRVKAAFASFLFTFCGTVIDSVLQAPTPTPTPYPTLLRN